MWLMPSFSYWKAGCEGYDVSVMFYPWYNTTAIIKRTKQWSFISQGCFMWVLSDGWMGDLEFKCKAMLQTWNRPPAFLIPSRGPVYRG